MLSAAMVEAALAKFRPLISRDGGSLELIEHREAEALVRYAKGVNEECESCILSEEDLSAMIEEALAGKGQDFRIVMVSDA